MPRGGKRQGTPGKGYANRTDLGLQPDMEKNTAAAGGMTGPKSAEPMRLPVYPEDTPNLTDPSNRPMEPLTDGLPVGPGRGPEALTNYDPRLADTAALKKWLPLLNPLADNPDVPDSVRTLVRYIRAS